MKTLLPLLLIIPSLSWGKEVYLSCKIISKMLWGSEEYEVKEFYDEQNINLLVKNRSLIIDDYQNFSFSVDGREVDGERCYLRNSQLMSYSVTQQQENIIIADSRENWIFVQIEEVLSHLGIL